MSINPDIAEVVSLLGETSRAAMLTGLLDGRFHTAGELAYMASVTPQTASFHLSKLVQNGWITAERHGRYRYYQLANREVAQMLETMLTLSPPPQVRSLRQSTEVRSLREARTCYDHLAGQLGVKLTEAMVSSGYLLPESDEFKVTAEGEAFFAGLGLNLTLVRRKRRAFAHACLDWSERRHHLGGALGHELVNLLLQKEWIVRMPSIRAVKVTDQGRLAFRQHFHLDWS
ncbi:ArsR/SmtB family transcription factor [Paenibacillus wulumuqiensis]|uniref:ArsR/SmtB family transcription factor n=1 Tax=Paenibacillus wulumuqiensis TaxID=1567107 RepID=UPI000619C501|nr:helix-turn-helix domain-containing protein [Paenibacillus wulumuqiensis]